MKGTIAILFIAFTVGCSGAAVVSPEPSAVEAPAEDPAVAPEPPTETEEFAALFGDDSPHTYEIAFTPPFTEATRFPLQVCFRDELLFSADEWEKGFRFWEAYTGRKLFEFSADPHACNVIAGYSDPGKGWAAGRAFPTPLDPNDENTQNNFLMGNPEWLAMFSGIAIHTPYWRLVAHELGHILGFLHSDQSNCIMASSSHIEPDTGCDLSPLFDAIAEVPDAE